MNKSKVFFTADTHFGHDRIRGYCNRPYQTVEEMDEMLIKNWNETVPPDADVYHLGDFAFGKQYTGDKLLELINRLNGEKYLILGNHDHATDAHWRGFKWIKDYYEFPLDKRNKIILFHYAMRVWHRSHYGNAHLYGHSHGTLPDDPNARSFDVGVDCWNYRPISLNKVESVIAKKKWKAVDHHGDPLAGYNPI
jgi:calcineurin-like phosphoesterase family protein